MGNPLCDTIGLAIPGFGIRRDKVLNTHQQIINKLDMVHKIGKEVGANAVRFVLKDYDEYNCNVGDILYNKSRVWKNGEQTNEMLNGLCFILLDNLNMIYCYDVLLFIYAEDYIIGGDKDEIIVSDPTVLHITRSD